MRLAWQTILLLPALLLPIVVTEAQTCSNGLTGYEASSVCCPASCGSCGGSGCSKRGEGCCTSDVKDSGVKCSVSKAAPCNIDTDTVDTGDGETCSNGIPGIDGNGVVCCPTGCGQCGGSGCSTSGKAAGLGSESCCGGGVKASAPLCSVSGTAPCVIDSGSVTPTPTPGNTCSNGLAGYEASSVCCPLSCGSCGGSGCSKRGEGCCTSDVKDSGVQCSVSKAAPCNIDTDTVDTGDGETCSNGIPGIDGNGVVCCPTGCGQCGGSGCSTSGKAAGLGSESCCGGGVKASAPLCSVSGTAPCVIDEGSVTPTPITPTPITPTPITPTPTPPTPTPNPGPAPIMTIPSSCTSSQVPEFRYAATSGKVGKGRLYAESPGCFTMTDIYNWRGIEKDGSSKGPIYMLDDSGSKITAPTSVTKKWLLEAELYVTDGAVFYCIGSDKGGDCDELRIRSMGSDDFYEVRGHGGSLYFSHTVVTSWDVDARKPQEKYVDGRSFLNCVSEKLTGETCVGRAKNEMGECRMDIINSEMGYMGWFDSESYGLTWKVRGFCKDLSNPDVFETTNVYGDILNSDIHHMYYGHYTYGHQGGVWDNNKMHDNWQYGFDPHDDSDYLTISNNEVYNNVNHGIIASKRCNNVKIFNNVVRDGGADAAGIFLHRSSDNAEVYNNKIYNMQDAGIALLESKNARIYENTIDGAQFGIRMSLGSEGNTVYRNKFNDCSDQGLYTYEGSDEPTEGVSDGRPLANWFHDNDVTNTKKGVKLKNSDNIKLTSNTFTGTEELEFYDAQNTEWVGNNLPSGVCIDNISSDKGSSVRESTFASGSSGLPSSAC